jgi:hypothetical protein
MWERRILSSLTAIVLGAVGGTVGVHGFGLFLYVAAVVSLAMTLGIIFEPWIQVRHRSHPR